jgi:leucyl-tRNA synthetase
MEYKPRDIEKQWKAYWDENKVYQVNHNSDRPKYYVLDMFPYPSGAGLHVGHPLGYIASDIFARYKRLKGFNVLHPMGYDAFGLPAEQYAISTGVHPAKSTAENIDRYRQQLENLGFSYDWEREVRTCDPSYYKWTQWIFLLLFEHYYDVALDKAQPITALAERFAKEGNGAVKATTTQETQFSAAEWNAMNERAQQDVLMNYRLAYRKSSLVNWCEALGSVLANDEVKDGVSERGGYPVERRPMLQWSLRITAYAERLLNDLDTVQFSEAMKKMQANWIGRSVGAQMFFDIVGSDKKIEIFTTRPDTIFGATYMVLAPEHDLVPELTTPEQKEKVAQYLKYVNSRTDIERKAEVKEVTGEFLGSYALNPFSNEHIPIWIGEYVLKDYGTGAIMAVPSDDDRDEAFASKFGLKSVDVVDKSNYPGSTRSDKEGIIINSDFLNGMEVPAAIDEMLNRIESMSLGKRQVNFKLRDALFSRQRYWGEPFPVIYDTEGIVHPMAVADLPLELPEVEDFKPASGGQSPLARATDWVNQANGWKRETDTMPGSAGSSWYFLRYMDPKNDAEFASPDAVNYWQDVDLYIGGTEHAVGHLMYSRFWHKFLYDLGKVPTQEPYRRLVNQGMIQGVIESMYLQKEKVAGVSRFVDARIAAEESKKGVEFTRIPVHVDYVTDYGKPDSYLDETGIAKFVAWMPTYADAIFEGQHAKIQHGQLIPTNGADAKFHLTTHSEVGKMSKSKFNVINPDDMVEQYGADCFRMYEMFLGPIEDAKPWNTNGIDGVSKFLRKFWSLFFDKNWNFQVTDAEPTKKELKALHNAIRKVTEDIERFSLNTCVSNFMIAVNELKDINCNNRLVLQDMTILIAPFAPFIAEELWHRLGNTGSVHQAVYPVFNPEYLKEDNIQYPVQINGKVRANVDFPVDTPPQTLQTAILEVEAIKKWTEGKEIKKVIVVPKRMINIVVGE